MYYREIFVSDPKIGKKKYRKQIFYWILTCYKRAESLQALFQTFAEGEDIFEHIGKVDGLIV